MSGRVTVTGPLSAARLIYQGAISQGDAARQVADHAGATQRLPAPAADPLVLVTGTVNLPRADQTATVSRSVHS